MSRRAPGWLGVGVGASLGGLAGVLVTLALGGGSSTRIETITTAAPAPDDVTLVSRTAVPPVVGRPLGAGRREIERAGFLVEVEGAGPLGLLLRRGWRITAQTPRGGLVLPTGTTVALSVALR